MRLERVVRFLESCERARVSSDGYQLTCRCPFCNDSQKSDHGHLSIKIEVEPNEPMLYSCFRAACGKKGILTTEDLQLMGCTDQDVLFELAKHNQGISKKLEKNFNVKEARTYEMVNLPISNNKAKLDYLNRRLGTKFQAGDLRNFKIQLSLYDFLNLNGITKLAYNKRVCDNIDLYTIGFLSMYNDYMICRDITPEIRTGLRYNIYRTSGKPSKEDMKLYCIPTEIDLLDPNPAEINVAEGTFSILGAYLHTDIGKDARNNLWLANCGTGYHNTIMHVTKQYGLLDVVIHIWSDSEIPISTYEKLYHQLRKRLNVVGFQVHRNSRAEDFGFPKKNIEVETITIK